MSRILIVDDEPNVIRSVERLFLDTDHTILSATDGPAALDTIADFHPDIVILDIMIPGMNGYEVCRRLKADPGTAQIMVLLLSGKGAIGDRLTGYECRADDFLAKPFDPEELVAKVRILLRLKSAQDELLAMNTDLEKLVEKRTRELVIKERQALVGQMVQGIIHNYQGPLMVVHARADIAARALEAAGGSLGADENAVREGIAKAASNVRIIEEAAEKVEEQIRNLLSKSRAEATDEKQVFSLNDLISHELEFLDADMELKHGVRKSCQLDCSLGDIFAVYSDFSQLMYNMVKNASDAMRESPVKELTVSTTQGNGIIRIEFRDTGAGISPENIERIFKPFFTTKCAASDPGSSDPSGTGLGLSTCVQLMKAYGGEITVASEPGAGTAFTVSIPVENVTPPREQAG